MGFDQGTGVISFHDLETVALLMQTKILFQNQFDVIIKARDLRLLVLH